MDANFIQLGGLVALFALAIREFFVYIKGKKNGTCNDSQILAELQKMNSNHLHTLDESIRQGNRELVEAIHTGNMKIVELLSEIKGNLYK